MTSTHIRNHLLTCVAATLSTPVAKTVADKDTPEAITATATWFRRATFYGKATAQGAANTDSVFVGCESGNGANAVEIIGGGENVIEAPLGCRYNLADFYCDVVVDGEGVVVIVDADRSIET